MNISSIINFLQRALQACRELEKDPSSEKAKETVHERLNDLLCEIIALKCTGPKDTLQTTMRHVKQTCDQLPKYADSLWNIIGALVGNSIERVQIFLASKEPPADIHRPLTAKEAELLHDICDYLQNREPTQKMDIEIALHMLSLIQGGFSKEAAYTIVHHRAYHQS